MKYVYHNFSLPVKTVAAVQAVSGSPDDHRDTPPLYTEVMAWPLARISVLLVPAVIDCAAQQPQRPEPSRPASELERAAEEFKTLTRELGLRPDSPPKQNKRGSPGAGWHGRIFENFRNDLLDAVPHDVVQRGGTRNLLRRNQFGFNAGGPVVIPRLYDGSSATFFNISYEGVRERIGRSYLRTVAIAPEHSGNFAQTVDSAGNRLPIYDPLSTRPNTGFNPSLPISTQNLEHRRDPFAANTIPITRLDPVALRATALYPLPNANAGPFFRNNYFVFSPETNHADGMILKLDHAAAARHRLTVNVSFTDGLAKAPRYFSTVADSGGSDRKFSARRAAADWTFTRNASTVNTLTFEARSDRSESSRPGEEGARDAIGLQGPLSKEFPVFRFGDYLGMGRTNPTAVSSHNYYYLTEGLSLRIGKHRPRFVSQLRRYLVNAYLPQYPSGRFSFGPSLTSLPGIVNTGHSFASFLLGLSEAAEVTRVDHPSYWRGSYGSFGVRDNYEHSRGLNFSFAFSLEASFPRTEKYDRFSTVDLSAVNPAGGRAGALVFANRDGRGRAFQPVVVRPETSFGLAWNPRGDAKSVVRLSYGLSFSSIPIYTAQWGTQGFAGTPAFISTNIQLQPAIILGNGVPPIARALPDLRPDAANFTVADLVDPSGTVPTYQSAGLSFERELPSQIILAVNLGHSRGQRMFISNSAVNPNAIPLSNLAYRDELNTEAFRRTLRPYPQYQRFDVYSSWPAANYKRNSGALRVEKRSASGLTLNATYEFSKQMDDYSGPYGVQDYYNKKNEWSLTSSNVPHRLSLSFAYELPLGSSRDLLAFNDWRRYIVDGWSISGITSVQSGEPLALRPQFNNTGGLIDALRVNVVPGIDPAADRTPDHWFNPAAFEQPPDFTPGNGPRTHPQLLSPGNQNHDLSVTKRIALSAERAVEVTATGFNFTNTGNWADPDPVIGPASAPNVNAGRIIGSRGGRVIQLGMRFSF